MRILDFLRRILFQPATLGARATRAGVLSTGQLFIAQGLRLAGNLVMTRLLLPEAFGLMAIVGTLLAGLTLMSDLGINRSVVRSPEGEMPHYLRVAWVVQAIRGTALAGLVLAVAGLLAVLAPDIAPPGTVYADPRLPGLVALAALAMLMKGFESPNQFVAMRRMAAGRIAAVNLASQVAGLAAMIGLGLASPTVWALVAGMLAGGAVRLALTHLAFDGPRMAFAWDQRITTELWDFGKWLLGSSALTFVAGHADRLILGALLDTESLGFYTIALMWVQAGRQLIGKLTGSIGFSVFSEVRRSRPGATADIFRRFTRVIDGLCLAGFLAVLFGGPFLIHLLYPASYAPAAALMPLLGVLVLSSRFDTLGMLVLSEGNSQAMLSTSALRAAALCLALPLAFMQFGIAGALLATALSPLAAAPLLIARARPVLKGRVGIDLVWLAAIPALAALIYLAETP